MPFVFLAHGDGLLGERLILVKIQLLRSIKISMPLAPKHCIL